jgi:hypothetical protein
MTSTSIYKPTWLYIKRHTITGLKYFGKTVQDVQTILEYYLVSFD